MRITIACKQFGTTGGAETFLMNFARCLLEGGHRVRVLAARGDACLDGIEFARLPLARLPRSLRDLALARASARALAADDADVTFSDAKCWGADVVRPGGGVQRAYVRERPKSHPSAAARLLDRLYRALSVREYLRIHIDDRLYAPPGPRCVIANSDMVRRNLVRYYPHLADRIRVVYNGADAGRFHPSLRQQHRAAARAELGIPPHALVGVFVGHDWRRKGLYPFIEALGILARKDTERPVWGLIVGRGKRRGAERFARGRGAGERLAFAPSHDAARYYGAADLLVLPSFFDPCANVTVEALACGLPTITSVHNGAFEMLTPGLSGFYVHDAGDAAQLAGFIAYYLDEQRLADGRRAALALAARYTLAAQYARIMQAVEETASRKHGA